MEVGINPPWRGPEVVGELAAIAVGAYTDIVAIYGPAEALYGEVVTIEVVVRNLASYAIYIAVTSSYDGVTLAFSPSYATVGAGATYTFTAQFTMPNKGIKVNVWSWYWTGTEWYQDDYEYINISLRALTPEFQSFGVKDYSKI